MSRRSKKTEKRISVDPKFNSELIAHVIRVIMKDGKEKIADEVQKNPAKFEKGEGDQKVAVTEPIEIISQAIENMKPKVEVKTRRVGGTTYPVPVEINPVRQLSLALRWMTTYASGRHGMGMPAAVAAEIIDAFQGQGNVIKKRDDVHKMAAANKAFAHYAW